MPNEIDPRHLSLDHLAQKCAQETTLYFQHRGHDSRYCFELFRRAIRERDQSAWDMICHHYQPLVTGWVRQHPGFETSSEKAEYFVNGAFGKLAGTLTPDKFGGFMDIRPLLQYLKMCVHSVIVDHNRLAEQMNLYPLEVASTVESTDSTLEEQVMDRSYRQMLWKGVDARLHDEKEHRVMYGLFVLGFKPQELYERFRKLFSSVDEIYRTKQNVIARLRRDPEIRKLLGEDD
jgi:hypothetical protein